MQLRPEAACPSQGTAAAAPTPAASVGLPPIGSEVASSMLANNVPMTYKKQLFSIDLRGGIKQRVERNPSDPDHSVLLRTEGFRVSGEHDGASGTATFEQSKDTNPQSTL
ncbi:hypothetical protein ACIA6C_29625 [Streptomyces sp. NPDC051578]|uniref:hypothetical protein n=1 Tax=Streptomyces sp. NPDC051578 TaxID=3365662 RepID=UPI0037A59CA4